MMTLATAARTAPVAPCSAVGFLFIIFFFSFHQLHFFKKKGSNADCSFDCLFFLSYCTQYHHLANLDLPFPPPRPLTPSFAHHYRSDRRASRDDTSPYLKAAPRRATSGRLVVAHHPPRPRAFGRRLGSIATRAVNDPLETSTSTTTTTTTTEAEVADVTEAKEAAVADPDAKDVTAEEELDEAAKLEKALTSEDEQVGPFFSPDTDPSNVQ